MATRRLSPLLYSFTKYLVTANVPPKVAQTLARHSTIALTMDRYAHLGVFDLVDALKPQRAVSAIAVMYTMTTINGR